MTVDQFIALSSSIGACLAAAATFWTVYQMKMQREWSYHPDLCLSLVMFETDASNAKNLLPIYWKRKNSEEEPIEPRELNWFKIPIHNVGLGTAKEVIASWSIPVNDFLLPINEMAQRTTTPASFTFQDDVLSIKSEKLLNSHTFWKHEKSERIDYILPVSVEKKSVMLKLPLTYIYLASAVIFFNCKDSKENNRELSFKIPALRITLEYFDIGKVKHIAVFELHLDVANCGGNGEIFLGYLQPLKV